MEELCSRGPLTDADIHELADMLLRRHGRDAVLVADMQAEEKLTTGDMEGYRTWKRLLMLVDEMLNTAPPERAYLH